ncbi:MAG TPA: amino acid permease [Solirubrobacteraceae bacterium]|jgi:amino acid transporter|nr:amino acid permease [Solirubrobacteraceae bacterium]
MGIAVGHSGSAPEPVAKGGLFTRQASGLVRELGIPAAVGISLASVAVVNTFINFNAGLTDFSKSDMYLPLLAGAFIWLVAMFAYRHLLEAIPRAGGEYVFLSRVVSPVAGAMAGIGIAVVFTYVLAANAHFAATFTPFMLTALGSAFSSASIGNAANDVGTNLAVVLISCGVMVIVALASLFSLKRLAQIILALIVVQLLAFLCLAVLLADHSHADFVSAFARYTHHPGAYQALISLGHSNGLLYGTAFGAMIAIIPFMVLNYNGVLYSYYVGGELRRPGRTYLFASAISIGLLVIVWGGVWALLRHTAGLHFMQAQANLGAGSPAAYAKVTSLSAQAGGLGYGLVLSGDPVTKILFGVAVPVAEIAVNLAFVAVTTRVLFALAFDRLLPLSVAKINERNHAPVVAIGIVIVVGIAFCILTTYADLTNIVALESLFFALILLAGGVAATFLASRRSDLLLRPGATELPRWLGVPRVTWAGGLTTVLALFTIVEVLVHSSVYGKLSAESITTLIIVLGAGPVVYLIASSLRRRRNQIDIGMSMRELPPE